MPETIGERIRFIRERRGLRQTELAKRVTKLGVPLGQSVLSRFEKDARRPQLEHVLAISMVLEVTPADLGISRDDYPEAKFLKDPATLALLEATPSLLSGKRTARRRPRKESIQRTLESSLVAAVTPR